MIYTLDNPINALSLNKDATKVVVAGRNVFKIFKIEEDGFKEEYNLRSSKLPSLNFSSLDVAWSSLEDNIVASAATNGAVVIWDLNKLSKNKADTTYSVHKRSVNKVAFHPTEASCLLSGSQDATVKLFDLRKKEREATLTFNNGNDSVRDLQFAWHSASIFAAADEAGNIKCWDVRNNERPVKQLSSMGGPVLSLDFHPTAKTWIASGGRDKIIKIWDWQTDKPSVIYSVQTTAPVCKIKWRLNREWHIASCSMVIDYCIHVWDIRRPYIPFATFDDHSDVPTSLAWRHEPHVFLSCGKDGKLIQHLFRNALRPFDLATPVAVSINPFGDIACSFGDHLLKQRSENAQYPKFGLPSFGQKNRVVTSNNQLPKASEQFRQPIKSTFAVNFLMSSDNIFSSDWFIVSAKHYKLSEKPIVELCEHNARIAAGLSRPHIVQTWLIFKELFDSFCFSRGDPLSVTNSNADTSEYNESRAASTTVDGQVTENAGVDNTGVITETETEEDAFVDGPRRPSFSIKHKIYHGISGGDMFNDGELSKIFFEEFDLVKGKGEINSEWKLPAEAFDIRPEIYRTINEQNDGMENGIQQSSGSISAVPDGENLESGGRQGIVESKNFVNFNSAFLRIPSFDSSAYFKEVLTDFVEKGDLQTAISCLVLLGEKSRHVIDEYTQLWWYRTYIDLLERFRLWTTSALIIKLSPLPEINCLSQQSTSVSLGCMFCEKPLQKRFWWCQKCKRITNSCSVCQQVVKGLFVCCQGCSHGGHLIHVKNWFEKHPFCPAGCGHRCSEFC